VERIDLFHFEGCHFNKGNCRIKNKWLFCFDSPLIFCVSNPFWSSFSRLPINTTVCVSHRASLRNRLSRHVKRQVTNEETIKMVNFIVSFIFVTLFFQSAVVCAILHLPSIIYLPLLRQMLRLTHHASPNIQDCLRKLEYCDKVLYFL